MSAFLLVPCNLALFPCTSARRREGARVARGADANLDYIVFTTLYTTRSTRSTRLKPVISPIVMPKEQGWSHVPARQHSSFNCSRLPPVRDSHLPQIFASPRHRKEAVCHLQFQCWPLFSHLGLLRHRRQYRLFHQQIRKRCRRRRHVQRDF